MKYFRFLRADEIDVRVNMVRNTGVSLLLYKDARVDQNILDETFGIFGWQRSHQMIGSNLYCTVTVKDPETGEWIGKQDVGTESYTEKEKGQASDSFKRACFNLGIGRELYTAPFIWISAGDVEIKGGRTYDRFAVKSIGYSDDGVITQLEIVNCSKKNKIVFAFGTGKKPKQEEPEATDSKKAGTKKPEEEKPPKPPVITEQQLHFLRAGCERHNIRENFVSERYGKRDLKDMTPEDYAKAEKDWKQICEEWDKSQAQEKEE